MFKFLDNLIGSPVKVAIPFARQQTTAELVEEIHTQFLTASDRMLAEAKAVLDGTDETVLAKAARLNKLGFRQAIGVQEAAAHSKLAAEKKEVQRLIVEYSIKYPTYRVIDEAQIEAICAKYNLVFGSIKDYKGFVPEKSLREIEAFPGVKEEDAVDMERSFFDGGGYGNVPAYRKYGEWHNRYESISKDPGHLARMAMLSMSASLNTEFRSSKSFLICAPVKDMDMNGKELDGHKVVRKHIPDPVVLVPVKGNLFIILTCWGDEASDPMVMKENLN